MAVERDAPGAARIGVWDLPTRVFHWTLAILVAVSIVTGTIGENLLAWHERSGVLILILILFRIGWGFIGGHHARFASFVRGPGALLRYARGMATGAAERFAGHNPLGGWSVLAMILCLAVQVATGLFANDDATFEGPLAGRVSKATGDWITHLHHLNVDILYVLIGLHLAAIAFYLLVKRDNLVRPMITGWKAADPPGRAGSAAEARTPDASPPPAGSGTADPADTGWRGSIGAAAAILVAAIAIAWLVIRR